MLKTKNPPCLYCQKRNTYLFLSFFPRSYFKCENCQLVFLYPLPSLKEKNFFNKKIYGEKKNLINYLEKEEYWRKRARKILKKISLFVKNGQKPKLLDVGCYSGIFLDEARKWGWEVRGIEQEKEAVKFVIKRFNLPIINKDFLKVDFKEKFDVITLIDVFEHFSNLSLVLKKIKTLLTLDGILFIQCPNIESLMFKITKKNWHWLLPEVHFYHFSLFSLKKILKENGFKIVEFATYDDISEFSYNVIDVLRIKKRNFFEKIIWKGARISSLLFLRFSFLWSYLNLGGLINVIAKKTG